MQFVILFLTFVTTAVCDFREISYNNSVESIGPTTFYEKSFANVLVRKKRGFVFFKGAVVVLTQVLSKHIIATAPRGVIHSSEVDMFYDLPILVEGWQKPLEKLVIHTKGARKTDKIERDRFENSVGVINASAIPLDKYYTTSYGMNGNRFAMNNRKGLNRFYNRKYVLRKPYGGGGSYSIFPTHNYYPNFQRKSYTKSQSSRYNAFNRNKVNQNTLNNSVQIPRTNQGATTDNPSLNEHREYRERRGIFEHVEGFGKKIGINLRKCILRAICEVKNELLPEGESFINDVARILFTIPTNHDNKDDDFVQMALDDGVDCKRRFMVSCPHSPLQYFFNNFRASNYGESPPMNEQEMMEMLKYAK